MYSVREIDTADSKFDLINESEDAFYGNTISSYHLGDNVI